jgi:hypothetical protein
MEGEPLILEGAMTHKQAVQRMAVWLRNSGGCTVVMAELRTRNTETPDVIGWRGPGQSTLIECKVSRGDFLADKAKVFRRSEDRGMGDHRYFAVPPGIVTPKDLPEGWGLLEICEKRVRTVQEATRMKANKLNEVVMLLSSIRRLEIATAVFVRHEEGDEKDASDE